MRINKDTKSADRNHRLRIDVSDAGFDNLVDGKRLNEIAPLITAEIERLTNVCDTKVNQAKKKNPDDFEDVQYVFYAEPYGYDGGVSVGINVYGLETDKEFSIRIEALAREAKALAEHKEAQRQKVLAKELAKKSDRKALYEQLQKEFGDSDNNPSTSLDSMDM